MTKRKFFAWALLVLIAVIPLSVFVFNRDGRDAGKECYEKCMPRFSRVVPDPKWIGPKTGKPVPLVCECY